MNLIVAQSAIDAEDQSCITQAMIHVLVTGVVTVQIVD